MPQQYPPPPPPPAPHQYYTDGPPPSQHARYPLPYRVPHHGGTPPPLTLADMRSQILANAHILLPDSKYNGNNQGWSTDHLEVVVARFLPSQGPQTADAFRYYGMLVKRKNVGGAGVGPTVLVKGRPVGSEIEALEWLLRDSEERVHGFAQEKAREVAAGANGECVVM